VEERTLELSNLNDQLKEEIEIRKRAEKELKELTSELKHSI
jgi:C4-dicarboxylate-specific signal transduction histidine kinase